jgi:hypothetical protein
MRDAMQKEISMWTLWLITFAGAQGAATPAVTPMATYQAQMDCFQAINAITSGLKKLYSENSPPSPGLMMCVPGALVRK